MAFPKILVDSATGSDTAASGAGPTTAVTGTLGVSAADGLSVIVDAGTDISGIATDGSAVMYFADATAGNRNFSKITATSGSGGATPTITVANAFGFTLTKAWAVGGKRASCFAGTSVKLFVNNAASGDSMPGWIIEMQSGHSESLTAAQTWQRLGDTTSGPITLQGKSGAATLPLLSTNQNTYMFDTDNFRVFQDFEIRNTAASKTASQFIANFARGGTGELIIRRIKCSHATNFFWRFWSAGSTNYIKCSTIIDSCEIGYTANSAILGCSNTSQMGLMILNCYIHDCGSDAILIDKCYQCGCIIYGNQITNTAGHGIRFTNSAGNTGQVFVAHNTVDSCASTFSGFKAGVAASLEQTSVVMNNIFSNNLAYGIDSVNSVITSAAYGNLFLGNNCYNNTSGSTNPASLGENMTTTNPTFTNTGGFNYAIGTNLKGLGYPVGGTQYVGQTTSTTYSYVDPGCSQRQEATSGPVGQQCQ